VNRHVDPIRLAGHLFLLSLREAWRNSMGMILFFSIPVVFLGAVQLTAGEGFVSVRLFYPAEEVGILLTVRHVAMVFAAAAVNGFLAAYYALILFHQDFEYFRFCTFSGLHPAVLLAGRFGFFFLLVLLLSAGTTALTAALVPVNHPASMFAGFLLIGVVYGACGGIAGTMTRDFLLAFLVVALLADIDAAWLQNPVYYSAGQNIGLIRWLPAFYPSQMIFASGFTEDPNALAVAGSLAYAAGLLVVLLCILLIRLRPLRQGRQHSPPSAHRTGIEAVLKGDKP